MYGAGEGECGGDIAFREDPDGASRRYWVLTCSDVADLN